MPPRSQPRTAGGRFARKSTTPSPSPDHALVAFLDGWRELQEGPIVAGQPFVLHYEPARLAATAEPCEIVGFARFLPSGIVRHTVLRAPVKRAKAPASRVAAELAVPHETRHVELWFKGVGADGATVWDSRFGTNYQFEVVRPEPSPDTLPLLAGAVVDVDAIAMVADGAVKANEFASRPGYPSGRTRLRTTLRVGARVGDGEGAAPTRVWIDVRGFDADAAVVHSATRDLARLDAPAPDGAMFALNDLLYQGSVATPGSVTPRPDIRAVHYRLYAERDGVTYSDDIVYRCELATDSLTR